MLVGKQSWIFKNNPVIAATGVTGGPFEAKGKLADDFDILHDDLWMGHDSYEKAHRKLIRGSHSDSNYTKRITKRRYSIFDCR